jgi:uncharacterized protein (DUF983 family)
MGRGRRRKAALGFFDDLKFCLKPRCPVCRQGRLFRPWTITVAQQCNVCNAYLGAHDIGDGAAVMLIFLLGFTVIPLAWAAELAFAPPLWAHVIVWGLVTLGLILLILPTTKAYIIMLEYRHLKK